MKPELNKETGISSKKLFFETFENLGLRLIVYVVPTIVILAAGKFFWWVGLILFIILSVYLLSELLTNGFVLLIAAFTATAYSAAYSKLKIANKSAEAKKDRFYLVLTNVLLGIYCLIVLLLESALFIFFFKDYFR